MDGVLIVLVDAGPIGGREAEGIEPDGVVWRSTIKEAPVRSGRAGLQIDHEEFPCFISSTLDRGFVIDSAERRITGELMLDLYVA